MCLLDVFRRRPCATPEPRWPKIEFGFRGEGVNYGLPDKGAYVGVTLRDGARLYSEEIAKWDDGRGMTEEEKQHVFVDILSFLDAGREKPIVVINKDDPSKDLWEALCVEHAQLVGRVEYTSDEELLEFERKMYLRLVELGGLTIDGVKITSEQQLDQALRAASARARRKISPRN